jgi:shikimate kinase
MSTKHLVLIGLMGAGKSTVGERCAQLLDRPCIDTDEIVEAVAGATIAEIVTSEGEPAFRARELQAVVDACASPVPAVIACGGGAVLDPENRGRLRNAGFVVWLRAPADVLAERVADDVSTRPLLATYGAAATLERLAAVRDPTYEAVADAAVDTGGRSVDEVADAVVEAFRR